MKKSKIIKYIRYKLLTEYKNNIKSIILYGSRTRGDESKDSDYDCLIVVDTITGDILYNYNCVLSAIVISQKSYFSNNYNPFYQNIKKEGIEL